MAEHLSCVHLVHKRTLKLKIRAKLLRHVFRDSEIPSKIKDAHSTEPHKQYQIQEDQLSSSVFLISCCLAPSFSPYIHRQHFLHWTTTTDSRSQSNMSINLIYKHSLFPSSCHKQGCYHRELLTPYHYTTQRDTGDRAHAAGITEGPAMWGGLPVTHPWKSNQEFDSDPSLS